MQRLERVAAKDDIPHMAGKHLIQAWNKAHSTFVLAAEILSLIVDDHVPEEAAAFRPKIDADVPGKLPRAVERKYVEAPEDPGDVGLDISTHEEKLQVAPLCAVAAPQRTPCRIRGDTRTPIRHHPGIGARCAVASQKPWRFD